MDINVKNKLGKFFSKYKLIKYKRGEILLRAEDLPSGIFFLKEGIVRQYAISPKGDELTLNIYRPFSFFPMAYFINNTQNAHYFEAMTPVLAGRAPGNDFLKFIQRHPDIMFDLLRRIYNGLQGLFLRMEYLMAGDAKSRLVTELLIYARRFGKQADKSIMVDLKLTQKDLAAQSGIARETVGRIIKTLKEKGLISFKNKNLIINNLSKLEDSLLF